LESRALPLQLRQSLETCFLIMCVEYGYEVLVRIARVFSSSESYHSIL
jgi:hypothetical protein